MRDDPRGASENNEKSIASVPESDAWATRRQVNVRCCSASRRKVNLQATGWGERSLVGGSASFQVRAQPSVDWLLPATLGFILRIGDIIWLERIVLSHDASQLVSSYDQIDAHPVSIFDKRDSRHLADIMHFFFHGSLGVWEHGRQQDELFSWGSFSPTRTRFLSVIHVSSTRENCGARNSPEAQQMAQTGAWPASPPVKTARRLQEPNPRLTTSDDHSGTSPVVTAQTQSAWLCRRQSGTFPETIFPKSLHLEGP